MSRATDPCTHGTIEGACPICAVPIVDTRPDRSQVKEYAAYKPILDRIVVRGLGEEEEIGGFFIPKKFRQQNNRGEVVAVGQCVVLGREVRNIIDFVNVGDIVLFGALTAEEFATDAFGREEVLYNIRLQDVRGVSRLKYE